MNALLNLLLELQREPKAFQSDWARANAYHVAEAASRGYITCVQQGINRGKWYVSLKGVNLLNSQGAL